MPPVKVISNFSGVLCTCFALWPWEPRADPWDCFWTLCHLPSDGSSSLSLIHPLSLLLSWDDPWVFLQLGLLLLSSSVPHRSDCLAEEPPCLLFIMFSLGSLSSVVLSKLTTGRDGLFQKKAGGRSESSESDDIGACNHHSWLHASSGIVWWIHATPHRSTIPYLKNRIQCMRWQILIVAHCSYLLIGPWKIWLKF